MRQAWRSFNNLPLAILERFQPLAFFFFFSSFTGARFLRIIRICFHSKTIFGSSKRSVEHKQVEEAFGSKRGEERRGCFQEEFRTKCAWGVWLQACLSQTTFSLVDSVAEVIPPTLLQPIWVSWSIPVGRASLGGVMCMCVCVCNKAQWCAVPGSAPTLLWIPVITHNSKFLMVANGSGPAESLTASTTRVSRRNEVVVYVNLFGACGSALSPSKFSSFICSHTCIHTSLNKPHCSQHSKHFNPLCLF